MRKILRRAFLAFLTCLMVFPAVGCNRFGGNILTEKDGAYALKKSGTGLKFYTSDEEFDAFINDFYSRHIRGNNDKSIGRVKQGAGRLFQRDYEAKFISFYDSTAQSGFGYDAMDNLSTHLDANYVTQYGSVMDASYPTFHNGSSADQSGGLGWPFVSGWRTGNYSVEFISEDGGWTINGEEDQGSFSGSGYWDYTFNGVVDESLVYESPVLNESIEYAPLIEISMNLKDLSSDGGQYPNIEDIIVSFKMAGGEWHSLSYYGEAMYNLTLLGNSTMRAWFPAYLHPEWEGTLEGLRVEIKPKAGKRLYLKNSVNYFRLQTDTRLTNNNAWYVTAMEEYMSYTGDADMMRRNLADIRRATMFMIYALKGETGLLKTDYIWGKTTTVVGKNKYGLQGNGWYDCWPTGTVNLQANIEFYNTLLAMAEIEELATEMGVDVGDTYIKNPYPYADGATDVLWTHTPETLRTLAARVKNRIRLDIDDGGLWNPETGRFAWAIYDEGSAGGAAGEPFDHGTTEFNLYTVTNGIATKNQAESIMSWITGERTVEGDDATGDDIYFYEFAPRVNTKSNRVDNVSIHNKRAFGEDIQNGGASLHVSYYDLIARYKYYGADNSFARFKEIQTWYEKVQSAGGRGEMFYRLYYSDLVAEYGSMYKPSGDGQVGVLGLDAEFYESSLLYATIPTTYFGLDSKQYHQLLVQPNVPTQLEYMAIENLMFENVRYDLYVKDTCVILSGVRGEADGKTVKITLRDDGGKLYVNNQETNGFSRADGYITIELPLEQCVVEIK